MIRSAVGAAIVMTEGSERFDRCCLIDLFLHLVTGTRLALQRDYLNYICTEDVDKEEAEDRPKNLTKPVTA